MTVENPKVIDFVAHDPVDDSVLLVMVEHRPWGDRGILLPDLQKKLNTYLNYVVDRRLGVDYPEMQGKPVRIELRSAEPPGERERHFLDIVVSQHLGPAGIRFAWKRIGDPQSAQET